MTLAEAKAYGRDVKPVMDSVLTQMISDASDRIRAYTGRTFTAVAEARKLDWQASGIYDTGPISAVTRVTVDGTDLDPADYVVYSDRVVIRDAGPYWVPNAGYYGRYIAMPGARYGSGLQVVEIAATYGDTVVPPAIKALTAITAWRLVGMLNSGWQAQAGNPDLGTVEFSRLWTPDDYAVLKAFQVGTAAAGLGAV